MNRAPRVPSSIQFILLPLALLGGCALAEPSRGAEQFRARLQAPAMDQLLLPAKVGDSAVEFSDVAPFSLGRRFRTGSSVKPGSMQPAAWYLRATYAGNQAGMKILGQAYAQGLGVEQDYAQAAVWFLKGAQAGSSACMTKLAQLYAAGLGVPKDPARESYWRQRAGGN